MGRKKRATTKQDTRGYQLVSTAAAAAAAAPFSSIHRVATGVATATTLPTTKLETTSIQQRLEDLRQILTTLEEQSTTASKPEVDNNNSSTIPSDRFDKRIRSIYHRLSELHFSLNDMLRACTALGFDITFESALDWLCLHLSVTELPPLFVNNNDNTNNENDIVTVIAAPTVLHVANTKTNHDTNNNRVQHQGGEEDDSQQQQHIAVNHDVMAIPAPSKTKNKAEETKEDEEALAKQKAWLLEQYQYDEDEGDDDKADDPEEEDPRTEDQTLSTDHPVVAVPDNLPEQQQQQQQQQSPLQHQLQLLKEELNQAQADLNDEAANYMRSKYEVKLLDTKVKQLRKQVQGLERKVSRNQEAHMTTTQENDGMTNGGTEEEEDAGYAGLFNEDEAATTSSTPQAPPPPPPQLPLALVIPEDSIPASWTGKTPRKILEDYCRKQKMQRPRYEKLTASTGKNGCVLRVKDVVVEQQGPLERYSDAQEYVATKMLYQICSDLPLYQLFPPFYKDLWREWVYKDQKVVQDADQEEQNRRQEDIDQLIRAITERQSKSRRSESETPKPRSKTKGDVEKKDQENIVMESWEDREDDNLKGATRIKASHRRENGSASCSSQRDNERLRKDFVRRQESVGYREMMKQRSTLPIFAFRDHILETVARNPVTVVCAETGAGKTTQCPQFLLEEAFLKGRATNTSILCTQPRRIATTSVSERVAQEMCEPVVGKTVGYHIRLETRQSAETRLLFCTTGVILRRLVDDPTLTGVSHVIVDEVHERQWQIDVLLVTLRNLLNGFRPDLKVILMSATLDHELFTGFFHGAPLVSVPGRTFPVASYYLEDLFEATNHQIEEGSRFALRDHQRGETTELSITTRGGEKRKEVVSLDSELNVELSLDFVGYKFSTRRSMDLVNETVINNDLIEHLLHLVLVDTESNQMLLPPEGADLSQGSVLVFLPGIGEIRSLSDQLAGSRTFGQRGAFDIIPMHSSLSSRDQRRAFQPPSKGCRKIIVSTNICETSVTIPDVVCVIDCGRVRELQNDKRTSTPKLVPTWCSKANAKQRAGRAGRVQPGLCLKLFTSRTEKYIMKESAEPELKRIPLEEVCLNILATGMAQNCQRFLCQSPQPPSGDAIVAALSRLSEIGAITLPPTDPTGMVRGSETLTSLGRHLARLPVDARVGKMLVFGTIFKCIDPIATIAASLSASQSVFLSSMHNSGVEKAAQASFFHPKSDFLTLVNVYEAYRKAEATGESRKVCRTKYLNLTALREIRDARQHYVDLLCGIGLMDRKRIGKSDLSACPYNKNGSSEAVVHSVVLSGVYPNIAQIAPTSKGQGPQALMHRNQQLVIHSSSVNSKLSSWRPSHWVAFHEKFQTSNRVSVSTTCFASPFSLMLFGSTLDVLHLDRKVRIDGWIELSASAKTGVTFREVRKQIDGLLKAFIEGVGSASESPLLESNVAAVVDALVGLLTD